MGFEQAVSLFQRLRADGGRYLLSVGLTHAERDAQPEPTYGGKGHQRWLTDDEYTDLCLMSEGFMSCEHHGLVPNLAWMNHKCYACEVERLRAEIECRKATMTDMTAQILDKHHWSKVVSGKWIGCATCGIVQNGKNYHKLCEGPVAVVLRE